jgi:hypothetical protein
VSCDFLQLLQSGRGDLNPRPPRPERGALPSCATSRSAIIRGTNRAPFFTLFLTRPSPTPRASFEPFLNQGARERSRIGVTLFDCPGCGSAKSIEHGLCQVCLMEFPVETKVITLPTMHPAFSIEPAATQGAAIGEPS